MLRICQRTILVGNHYTLSTDDCTRLRLAFTVNPASKKVESDSALVAGRPTARTVYPILVSFDNVGFQKIPIMLGYSREKTTDIGTAGYHVIQTSQPAFCQLEFSCTILFSMNRRRSNSSIHDSRRRRRKFSAWVYGV